MLESLRINFKLPRSTKGIFMKRREFLTSTMLLAAVSSIIGKASGLFNEAHAAVVFVAAGKLGYKEKAPTPAKHCENCKHYKGSPAGGAGTGECTLPALLTAMKAKPVYVHNAGVCNMWAKKA